MKEIAYKNIQGTSSLFHVQLNENNQIKWLSNSNDKYEMNWARGSREWGTIKSISDLSVTVNRRFSERDTFIEEYVFKNDTKFDIYTSGTDVGIYMPFPDYYTDARTCLATCCHTHIWCGGSSSYIMAVRMGGEAPHLGIVLQEGGLQGYSVERAASADGRQENVSNHRGDFIFHPENMHLRPGDTYTLSLEMFWYTDKEEFEKKVSEINGFLTVRSDAFVVSEGEDVSFEIITPDVSAGLSVRRDGKEIPYVCNEGRICVCETAGCPGQYLYNIRLGEKHTTASFLVISGLDSLMKKRVDFIVEHQQCHDEKSYLNGAYLIYDNEEKQQYYSHLNDHNGGRERVGMGVLIAHYLQHHPDESVRESLNQYMEYVLRELYDEETGEVYNDAPRCNDFLRHYNAPWICRLFLEMYLLTGQQEYLDRYFKCASHFYNTGGSHFYVIGMPMQESFCEFEKAGRKEEAGQLLKWYKEHGDFIAECGKNYPAHEVDYEQSIVAPAAIYMGELYRLTGEEKYKTNAKEQYEILDLFQGNQPDYHMNEVAIRHWDGYWFGKRRMLGDTFPHYWSALSGYAFMENEDIAETDKYAKKAKKTLRGVLSMFAEDGTASCAMVYPMSVNGEKAHFYDPWANDQDWGLYFNSKYGRK